ncbi:hypothetical protein pEaSNUABM8_00204 [Erwinia phage pEa_SNUABM_8]|nr:hypothetical protein pEaSNUABM8_00204 [Erwinia phage pEa_SNUABM_8]QVW54956.1 hypothetical protein pEaSNUABM4_00203 [Erwinia phage pEa_SNUABM_4]
MNLIERAVKANDDIALVNVVIYKLSQKIGYQVASLNYVEILESEPFAIHMVPTLPENEVGDAGTLAKRIEDALRARHPGNWVEVKLAKGYRINGEFHHGNGAVTDHLDIPLIAFQVKVGNEDDGNIIHFHVDMQVLEAPFYAVDINRLIEMKAETTGECPVYLLKHQQIKDITNLDVVDDHVLDSVGIAALAAGWTDTETHSLSMLLID